MSRSVLVLMLLAVVAVTSSCEFPVEHHDWSDYDGPGKESLQEQQVRVPLYKDPVEPMNRTVSGVNYGFASWIVRPVAWTYSFVTTKGVRKRVSNVFNNFRYPVRLLGNVLQGNWDGAGRETSRFAINTTVGVLGIFDPATDWEIEPSNEDVGKAFQAWGWQNSSFLTLPVFGPSTVRDALALPFDTLLDPATYFFPASAVHGVNNASGKMDSYFRFVHTNYDPYSKGRYLWTLNRELETHVYNLVGEGGSPVETLGAVYLTFKDPAFPKRALSWRVEIASTGRDLPYDLWLQRDEAPLVFVLPGLGGHREASSTVGLAELAFNHGYSVVTISNAMNWEFMEYASSVALPGYAPIDANDVHVALDTIWSDVQDRYPGRTRGRSLMGMSLGAFHTLYIAAAAEDPDNELIDFDRYVAINPPVRLGYGLEQLDDFYDVPLSMPDDQRQEFVESTLYKAIDLYKKGDLQEGNLLPFTDQQAEFLIGFAFRITLIEVILCSQSRVDLGVLKTQWTQWRRSSVLKEISQYSYADYLYAFALPYFSDGEPTTASFDELMERCNAHSIEGALRKNKNIRVLTNDDDFLLSAADRDWLREVFGDHLTLHKGGGHLGELYHPDVQKKLMNLLPSASD